MILYSSSPNKVENARAALQLKRRGVRRVQASGGRIRGLAHAWVCLWNNRPRRLGRFRALKAGGDHAVGDIAVSRICSGSSE